METSFCSFLKYVHAQKIKIIQIELPNNVSTIHYMQTKGTDSLV